jgi:RNA polymerase primary sigma factor
MRMNLEKQVECQKRTWLFLLKKFCFDFGRIKKAHKKLTALRLDAKWIDDSEYQKHQDIILKELINFRFASKFVEVSVRQR